MTDERELYVLFNTRTDEQLSIQRMTFEQAVDANDNFADQGVARLWFLAPPDLETIECTICREEVPREEYYSKHYNSHPCE